VKNQIISISKKNLFFVLLSLFSFIYIFIGTGLHGDDYPLINEYNNKDLNYFFSLDPKVRNQTLFGIINHYFFYWAYPVFKYNNLLLYDLLKIIIHLISVYLVYKFISLYISKNRSIFFSFAFVFFPIHDSTIFWYMTNPYIFTPSIIFYSAYILKKNHNIYFCFILILIACFTSYSSPPFMLGICILFLLEKNYKGFFVSILAFIIYCTYYITLSTYFPEYEKRISEDIDIIILSKNYFLQLLTLTDTFFGLSFIFKIYSSISSINFFSFIIATILLIFSLNYFKFNQFDFSKNLFFSFIIICLSSLFIFSITNQYWQSPFNLGNRITVSSTLIIVFLLTSIKNNKLLIIIFFLLVVYPVFGLSDHWKSWNYNQNEIIKNIKNNKDLEKVTNNDLLIIKDNMYSQLGNFSHIELFVMPWVANSIFKKEVEYAEIFSLNEYSSISGYFLIDKKFNHMINLTNYKKIYVYATKENILVNISIEELKEIKKNIESKKRHWIQLIKNKYIVGFIVKISPRLRYLF